MDIQLTRRGDTFVVTLKGDLVASVAYELQHRLDGVVETSRPHVILDLSHVDAIDTVALAAIVETMKRVHAAGGILRVSPSPAGPPGTEERTR